MTANKIGNTLYLAQTEIHDPGNAGTISVDQSLAICNLVSAGAETRTLPLPYREGVIITFFARTIVGTITLTVTGGIDLNGTTTFAFSAVDQFLVLQSFKKADGTLIWLKISDYALGNLIPASSVFSNLTVTNNLMMGDNANVAFNAATGSMLATNNSQKMALWGATPVVQPSGTAELLGLNGNAATAGNATNMNSNGNVGATNYGFNDVIKAMKQAGLLKS
jgi:hypothetical protein